MRDYKQIYESCKNSLIKKNAQGVGLFEKAFLYAEKLHSTQFRKSGEPYILHPVEVMEILEKLDFDTDVLCGALLHDVIEDCGVTKQQLAKEFNKNIAEIVDCVSEFTNNGEEKWETELKTYQKLVSVGKNNLFGFYIKFADRLNNMKTLSVFPHYKQLDKVKQTLKYVLPIAVGLKTQFFESQLSSLCYFYSLNKENQQLLKSMYDFHINTTRSHAEKALIEIKQQLKIMLDKTKNGKLKDVILSPVDILEVKNNIFDFYNLKDESEIKSSCFVSSPAYELAIVVDDCDDLNKCFFDFVSIKNVQAIFKICDYQKDKYGQYFIVELPTRLRFKIFVCDSEQYILRRNGSLQGVYSSLLEEDFEQKIESDYITVYTPTNKQIYMPKNSTVLDFAFKIHKDFGFGVMYAFLNDSPSKSPIWTQLSPNDKIKLEIARDNDGQILNIAKIRWFAYAETELANKALVRHFEKMYEN